MNSKISTACKDCRWAKYDNITQIGCEQGLIEKYQQNGVNVVEAEDGDSGEQFYILENKVCTYYRGWDWKGDKESLEKELYPKIDVIILLSGEDILIDVLEILYKLQCQKFKPNHIRVVRHKTIWTVEEIAEQMQKHCNCPWSIDDVIADGDYKTAFNLAADQCEGAYLLFIRSSFIIPEDYFEIINQYLNSLLLTFVILLPNNRYLIPYANPFWRGMVIPRHIYKRIGGSSELDILEKIQILVEENEAGHLVKTYQEMKDNVSTKTS